MHNYFTLAPCHANRCDRLKKGDKRFRIRCVEYTTHRSHAERVIGYVQFCVRPAKGVFEPLQHFMNDLSAGDGGDR